MKKNAFLISFAMFVVLGVSVLLGVSALILHTASSSPEVPNRETLAKDINSAEMVIEMENPYRSNTSTGSIFDVYTPHQELVFNSVNYNSATVDFNDPWEAVSAGGSTSYYDYCDALGKQVEGAEKAGLSWKDVFPVFVENAFFISGDKTLIQNEAFLKAYLKYKTFSFRKSDKGACFVTFIKDDMDCMNPRYGACHVSFAVMDYSSEAFGRSMSVSLSKAKQKIVTEKNLEKAGFADVVYEALGEYSHEWGSSTLEKQ